MAWLFSGSTRTLGFPWTYRSLRTNGVDAFGGAADVFMFLRANESSDTGLKFSEKGEPMGYGVMSAWDFPGIAEALAVLRPVDLLLENDTSPTVLNPACSWSVGNFMAPRYAGQMESWRKVFQLMQRAEVRGNFSYDWVVHARPDSVLLAPLPNASAWGSSRGKRFWFPYCAGDNCGPVSGGSLRPLPASFRASACAPSCPSMHPPACCRILAGSLRSRHLRAATLTLFSRRAAWPFAAPLRPLPRPPSRLPALPPVRARSIRSRSQRRLSRRRLSSRRAASRTTRATGSTS